MNFVQLCEELIIESELLEEASSLLPNDPQIIKLAQDMKYFVLNKDFAKAEGTREYKAWRAEQLHWRKELKRLVERALTTLLNKKDITRSEQQLDDDILLLQQANPDVYEEPFKLLYSLNLGAENCRELSIPVSK